MNNFALQTKHAAFRLRQSATHKDSIRKFSSRKISQGSVNIVEKDPLEFGQEAKINMHISEDQKYVEWRNKVLQFCEKIKLNEKRFSAKCYYAPRLKNAEMQEHLSKVSDILRDSGYESWTRTVFDDHLIKFMNIRVECISQVLEEHRHFLLNDARNQKSLDKIKRASDVNLDDKEIFARFIAQKTKQKGFRKNITLYFPMRKIAKQNLPYSSLANFLSSQLEIEERVVASIWPVNVDFEKQITNRNLNYVYNTIERISMLLEAGASKFDILENYHLLSVNHKLKNFDLLNAVEEQKYIYGKVNLEEVRKYFSPKSVDSTSFILQKLLSFESQKSFNQVDRSHLKRKSMVNAARVFFLLSDEGFKKTELQKFVYLFIVDESDITQYIESKKGSSTGKMASLVKLTVKESNIDFPNLGSDLRTDMAFKTLTKGEKFLQEMQLYFEFRKDNQLFMKRNGLSGLVFDS